MAKLFVASDHAGFDLKLHLCTWAKAAGHDVDDLGPVAAERCDYPDFAHLLATKIEGFLASPAARDEPVLGLLVCGTGQGMNMAVNRHRGLRSVVCSDVFSAKMGRAHNDAQVLCLGQRVVGIGLAEEILAAFLGTDFEGGRHRARVEKIEVERV